MVRNRSRKKKMPVIKDVSKPPTRWFLLLIALFIFHLVTVYLVKINQIDKFMPSIENIQNVFMVLTDAIDK